MKQLLRFLLVLAPVVSAAPLLHAQEAGATTRQQKDESFARVTLEGAELRNIPDSAGRVLAKLASGTALRVHGANGAWVKAETPEGFAVWLHRRYVEATADEDVVRITRNGVNVRALPSSGVNNFPVGQLYAGDRVRVLETPADLAESAKDWVRVLAPEGFWAWMRSSHVATLPVDEGRELWTTARAKIERASAKATEAASGKVAEVSAEETARVAKVKVALEHAATLLEQARAADRPNWAGVREAYTSVLALDPDATAKDVVMQRLEMIDAVERAAELRAELEAERKRIADERSNIAREIDEETKRKDPLGSVFDERGVLERRTVAERTRYFLRWGGRDVCEVVCTTGRYDVDLFLGHDVGVRGEVLPLPASSGDAIPLAIVDISRVEILALH